MKCLKHIQARWASNQQLYVAPQAAASVEHQDFLLKPRHDHAKEGFGSGEPFVPNTFMLISISTYDNNKIHEQNILLD